MVIQDDTADGEGASDSVEERNLSVRLGKWKTYTKPENTEGVKLGL